MRVVTERHSRVPPTSHCGGPASYSAVKQIGNTGIERQRLTKAFNHDWLNSFGYIHHHKITGGRCGESFMGKAWSTERVWTGRRASGRTPPLRSVLFVLFLVTNEALLWSVNWWLCVPVRLNTQWAQYCYTEKGEIFLYGVCACVLAGSNKIQFYAYHIRAIMNF